MTEIIVHIAAICVLYLVEGSHFKPLLCLSDVQ